MQHWTAPAKVISLVSDQGNHKTIGRILKAQNQLTFGHHETIIQLSVVFCYCKWGRLFDGSFGANKMKTGQGSVLV